jgi:REP element-mobilizing transposase RayT
MPQKIVPIVEGETYHVFNRGVDKREIFLDKADYLRFYQSLNLFNSEESVVNFDFARAKMNAKNKLELKKYLVQIHAYSLLPNHFHLILKSLTNEGISEFMRRMSLGYTNYFNQKYERSGILFQGPFKRVHVDDQEQYQYLFAYVNENHFVHNLTTEREICHSSSLHYQGIVKSKLISSEKSENYQLDGNILLAKDIYERRKTMKQDKVLFE